MKNKIPLIIGSVVIAGGIYAVLQNRGGSEPEIQFNYAPVVKGEVVRSISATGQLVALTKVDVKSKAGGKVVKLLVEEGSYVKAGQLIAQIDPSDTEAVYRQAKADLSSAEARTEQAKLNAGLTVLNSQTAIADAQSALQSAKVRLSRTEIEVQRQPAITRGNLATAQAALATAQASLERYNQVSEPQVRRDLRGEIDRTTAALEAQELNLQRVEALVAKGYLPGSDLDLAKSNLAAARSAKATADQKYATLEMQISKDRRAIELQVDQAKAALTQARANSSQVQVTEKDLLEAKQAVRAAEINLQQAQDAVRNNQIRASEVRGAEASTVRNQVTLENAKVQLDSTDVVAPRDGVVTLKYLEEGTIIPPGTSTFAQGTSLVQISDVTQMYVECAVDEADIANVKEGQKVRIITEAFPGQPFDGVVERVNPAATTEQNITAVKVRVRVNPGFKLKLLPGMNSTCEFITLEKKNVLVAPSQAIKDADGKSTVRVKGSDPKKPETREVEIGETGNDGVEIKSGLKEGDEVVTAEIDLAELREVQKKQLEAQQGGGLAGGGGMGGRRPAGGTGTRPGAGARPGGGAR
jgi:HlyD family secretion protein